MQDESQKTELSVIFPEKSGDCGKNGIQDIIQHVKVLDFIDVYDFKNMAWKYPTPPAITQQTTMLPSNGNKQDLVSIT